MGFEISRSSKMIVLGWVLADGGRSVMEEGCESVGRTRGNIGIYKGQVEEERVLQIFQK